MGRRARIQRITIPIVCLCLIAASSQSRADSLKTTGEEIVAAIAGTGIAIGVVIGLTIHAAKNGALEGCTLAGQGGLELRESNHEQTWVLLGDTGSITPGQHVRVGGKRQKKTAASTRGFIVEKVKKNYGACS